MKIRQTARHFAARKALELPVISDIATDKLVDLHTRVFLGKTDEGNRAERRAHLDAFFEATIDTYLAALRAGYTEAEAREITHIQANIDFRNHGWTEMMEIPVDEIDEHYERYRQFFEANDITLEDPLGRFAPPDGVPSAPSTPERVADPDYRGVVAGYADDVYVEDSEGAVRRGGSEEPEAVDPADAPGLSAAEVDIEGEGEGEPGDETDPGPDTSDLRSGRSAGSDDE